MRPLVAFAFAFMGFFVGAVLFIAASLVLAWTGPTSAPPDGNVSAPINVGTTDQIKNAGLAVNSLAVFGNAILAGVSSYLNFGPTASSSGYGFRDNAGTMEFKNSGGSWQGLLGTSSTFTQIKFADGTTQTTAAAGAIKQIVTASYSTQTSVAAGTFQDSGLSATITPTSPTSKIIIQTDIPMGYGGTCNAGGVAYFNVMRGSTQIKETLITSVNCGNGGAAGNQYLYIDQSQIVVDTPGTTGPVTYKIQGRAQSAFYFIAQYNNAPSTMVLEEI